MFAIDSLTGVTVADPLFAKEPAVLRAVERFRRDMKFTLKPQSESGAASGSSTLVEIRRSDSLPGESWAIEATNDTLSLSAADTLGAVYGLAHISRKALGVEPLWFWNDQRFSKKARRFFPAGITESVPAAYRFRGWFINDEVLLAAWNPGAGIDPWEMAFETLLRLGGNLVIPGTDRHSKEKEALASSMGLWITHHHAEPLGAEMFSRAYPELTPSYLNHGDLYRKLWTDAVDRQRDSKVV